MVFRAPSFPKPPLGSAPIFVGGLPNREPEIRQVQEQVGAIEDALARVASDGKDVPSQDDLRKRLNLERGLLRAIDNDQPNAENFNLVSEVVEESIDSLTDEQKVLLGHPPDSHGVILAGPGTGKSSTVLRLATRIEAEKPKSVKTVTFTRAATSELADKIRSAGHEVDEPTTVHAFALSVLMRFPELTGLPMPLRIPDDWETKKLIVPDLARRLRGRGYTIVARGVTELVNEMAAGWESLDPSRVLLSDLDPSLRAAFRATWELQRQVFGYTHFAEMTYRAQGLLWDLQEPRLAGLEFLIVDEFQDLNRSDIRMMEALAHHGVKILAVGDDDQSIYGFRQAAPEGIRTFADNEHFVGALPYTLSISFRLGDKILEAARELIEASPTRQPIPPLIPGPMNVSGEVKYLRFSNEVAEAQGVAKIIEYVVRDRSVKPNQVLVLMRGDYNRAWSTPIREELARCEIPVVDIEAALAPLESVDARKLIALARLMQSDDDLS